MKATMVLQGIAYDSYRVTELNNNKSRSQLSTLVQRGVIPQPVKIGHRYYFERRGVENSLREKQTRLPL